MVSFCSELIVSLCLYELVLQFFVCVCVSVYKKEGCVCRLFKPVSSRIYNGSQSVFLTAVSTHDLKSFIAILSKFKAVAVMLIPAHHSTRPTPVNSAAWPAITFT